ncbi:MAG: penicillin-binding protein 2 [Planctomycetes bacterium]|nr:penicillin-binding protein 2 [Planctomycetota bacterium]
MTIPPAIAVDDLQRWQTHRANAWARLAVGVIILLMLLVLARVFQLKTSPDPRLAAAAGTFTSTRDEPARRGDLLDRRGRIIASSAVGYRLFVDPHMVEDRSTIALDLTTLIGGDAIAIDRRLHERSESRYVVVRQLLESWQVETIRNAKIAGVGLDPRLVRNYPQGETAAALVGTVGFEHTGLSGMEHRYDDAMRPRSGRLTYLRAANRRPLWVDARGYEPAANGADVRLSIDLVVQELAERRVNAAVEEFNAGGGRMLVLDCETGEILAMHDVLRAREGWEEQTDDPARQMHPALGRNRCATDPYEPGSTFKPFIWCRALELGKVEPDEVLDTPESVGYRTSYGRLIRDSHYYGPADWRTVLVKSMNSGMAMIAERMSHAEMRASVRAFCFGERSGSGLPGESRGIVTPPSAWSNHTQSSVAMGHEIAVTPLQMVRAFSAFARDGTLTVPRLTAVGADEDDGSFVRRAIPEDLALTTRAALRDVMIEGTGRRARSEHYEMFGKSGTAQLPRREGGGYHEDRYVSSFIAGAPYDDPRLIVLCIIDDPDRSIAHYGGTVAGPAVRDVMEGTLRYLGVTATARAE